MIQVLDKTFEVYIDQERIAAEVRALAARINSDYSDQEVIFIAVLNGSFMFASDLMKNISLAAEITFIKVSSYHGTETTGRVDELIGLNSDLKNKHVIILEDIIDTGITIEKIRWLLTDQSPASVKVCSLLFKPDAFQGDLPPDYVGFSIPNAFVIGYGLDYNEKGRNLDAIYQIRQ
ncbi:MAG: hypoxanthine phosphoribosyltransferase [Bacteroidetes bacterium RIFCSPHIGHO2_02_FULL_44_7]|nr:MAG: hypoxanthine phosphoribosyltransferase [Bacteroidetes bacterium RIFCSPHIGHO2_02_FULL_44_7]